MGPPDDTPRKGYKFKGKDLTIGPLESPLSLSLDKHGLDLNVAETPTLSKLMNLIPSSSKGGHGLTSDSLKFDFDELVQHFPSPHHPSTFSPRNSSCDLPSSTWAGLGIETATSIGSIGTSFFNFPESATGLGPSGYGFSSTTNKRMSTPKSPRLSPLSSGTSTPGSSINLNSTFTPGTNGQMSNFSSLTTPGSSSSINSTLFEQGKFGSMKKRRHTPPADDIHEASVNIRNDLDQQASTTPAKATISAPSRSSNSPMGSLQPLSSTSSSSS
jgi:hypothetical protein